MNGLKASNSLCDVCNLLSCCSLWYLLFFLLVAMEKNVYLLRKTNRSKMFVVSVSVL